MNRNPKHKHIPQNLAIVCLFLGSICHFTAPTVRAFTIDFSAPTYSTSGGVVVIDGEPSGNLLGQDSWRGSSNPPAQNKGNDTLRIVANDSGGQKLTTVKTGTGHSSFYQRSFTDKELEREFNANTSAVTYTLTFSYNEPRSAPITILRVGIGNVTDRIMNALQIEFLSDGCILYKDGDALGIRAKTYAGGDFRAATGKQHTLTLTVDYGANTWRLSVDGVDQLGSESGSTTLALNNTAPRAKIAAINLRVLNLTNPAFRTLSIHKISASLLP